MTPFCPLAGCVRKEIKRDGFERVSRLYLLPQPCGLPIMETALSHRKLGIVAHLARGLKGYAGIITKIQRSPLSSQVKFEFART